MTAQIPYSFEADMADGRRLSHGDKPLMVADDATARQIEQLILELLQDEGDIVAIRFAQMSDYNWGNR